MGKLNSLYSNDPFAGRRARPQSVPRIYKKGRAPTTTDKNVRLADIWIDTATNVAYICVSLETGVATWTRLDQGLDYQESVLKQTNFAGAVAAEGNRYLSTATGSGWTADYIYEYQSGEWVGTAPSEGMVVFDEDTAGYLLYSSSAWGSFTTGITTIAAATDTSIAAPAGGQLLVYDGSNSWDNKTVSGDATLAAGGALTVSGLTFGSDAQGDIAVRGAAGYDRLSAKTDGYILIGDGTDLNSVDVTGDMEITNAGVTTVTDLTISSEAQGDILYFNGSNWVRLAAGVAGQSLLTNGAAANPSWGAPTITNATSINNNATLNDAGANDAILSFTTQTVGAPTLTIPDFASVSDTFCFVTLAQTLANKTLTSPILNTSLSGTAFLDEDNMASDAADKVASQQSIKAYVDSGTVTMSNKTLTTPKIVTTGYIADAGGDEYLMFTESATPVNFLNITSADTGVAPSLNATGSDANVDLLLFGKGTGNVGIADAADTTKLLDFELVGATTAKTMTITSSHTDDRALTLPDATDTLVGKATTDVFTNKSLDCDGAGNVLTNVNADELDPIAIDNYGVEFTIMYDVSNAATTSIYTANAPFKFRVLDAYVIETAAGNSGTWKIDDGTSDITSAVNYSGSDTSIVRAVSIDDANYEIAASGSLRVINSVATDDAIIVIKCLRFA